MIYIYAFVITLKNLDNRLRSLIRIETTNSETKGQLEFLLNLLCKGGDKILDQSSDNEQDNDDVKYLISKKKENHIRSFSYRKIKMLWKLI